MAEAKILFLDIETSPLLGYAWGLYEQNLLSVVEDWKILSVAWKWADEKRIKVVALNDTPEKELLGVLWAILDEADIVVAHNGDRFDIRKTNAKLLEHGFAPPSTYKTIDTLKVARKHFKFDSNRLTDLAEALGLGSKLPNPGFAMWLGCMRGDAASWKKMKEYNVHDVVLLEGVYLKLRPWHTSHPNLALYSEHPHESCPRCSSDHVQRRGMTYARTQVRQRWHCTDCGSWYSGKIVRRDVTTQRDHAPKS